ncbi:hypothetical protein ACIG0D_09660 [Streptomyces sp. NPDC052773]|jgi:hypothetical protein|nr:hypothetical protein [Streptomyces sp.]
MRSKAIELAGFLAMTLALALGVTAEPSEPEDTSHRVAQGEGPGASHP